MFGFRWKTKRAIKNFLLVKKKYVVRELDIAKEITDFMILESGTRPEEKNGLDDSEKDEIYSLVTKLGSLQRRRLERQADGLDKLNEMMPEIKQAYSVQISNIVKKIVASSKQVEQIYHMTRAEIDERRVAVLLNQMDVLMHDYLKHIDNILAVLSKKDLQIPLCDVKLRGNNGQVAFDTSVLINIIDAYPDAKSFNFDVGGNMIVIDKVVSELKPKYDRNKSMIDALNRFHIVTVPPPEPKIIKELVSIWRSADVNKDEDDFKNLRKADINLLVWVWNHRNERVTIVSDDSDIVNVCLSIERYYEGIRINTRRYADLRTGYRD